MAVLPTANENMDGSILNDVDSTDVYSTGPVADPESQNNVDVPKEPWWKTHIFVPILLFYMFANNVISTPLTNLTMDRVCTLNLNYSTETCQNMKNYTEVLDQVQILASNFVLYSTLIKTLPSACLSVLVGPWSDKYGRKPALYVSLAGTLLTDLGLLFFAFSANAPVFHILLYSIPAGLCGGQITVLGCTYTLAADNTDYRLRTIRYAFLQIAVAIGTPLGTLTAGLIYDHFGYVVVFASGFVFHVLVIVYLFVMIKESEKEQASPRTKISDFFSCENFQENVKIAMRKRENNGRLQVWLLLIASAIVYLNYNSVSEISYLFCNKMYHWGLSRYTTVITVYTMCVIVAMTIAMTLFFRVLKVPDSWLGLLGSISLLVENSIKAFAYQPWIYYIALASGLLSPVAPFAVRAHLSKSVEDNELGKLFTFLATLENLAPIPGSVLYTKVYNSSIAFFPGLAFLIAAATLLFPSLVFVWLARLPRVEAEGAEKKEDQGTERDIAMIS